MGNPFFILKFVWKARRPSRITDMPAVKDSFWLRQGYAALTFFGTIITASGTDAESMNSGMNEMKNHEMIHLRQARQTHDSWLCFYLLYIWYYLRALPMNRKLRNAAYYLNPFELEAYRYMNNMDYLNSPDCGKKWKSYAKMKPKERLRLVKVRKG